MQEHHGPVDARYAPAPRDAGVSRRTVLRGAAASALTLLAGCKEQPNAAPATEPVASTAPTIPPRAPATTEAPASTAGPNLVQFPEKTDLILLTDRPPCLETPTRYFTQAMTPNDAFFVRWHLASIPTSVDTGTFRLKIGGYVEQPIELSLDELRQNFEPASIVAANQCSGNSRQFFSPRVPGGQWGNGAVGNAKWTGVRLKELLEKAKPKSGAIDVSFNGLDQGVIPATPDFVKSLSVDHATHADILVAYEMNGQPLPMLNGFPLRLIVPGWFATYWVKALNEIQVLPEKFTGFWMAKAYRVPDNPQMSETPGDLAKDTVPISKMPVRSLFATPAPGEHIPANQPVKVQGVAFDGGSGIASVEVSADGGKRWIQADLDDDLGKYSFRLWHHVWTPTEAGEYSLMARATSNAGETQPATPKWNRSGYARNVIESISVTVS